MVCAVLFMALLSFLIVTSTGYVKDFNPIKLSEHLASSEACDEDAIFPQPPCCGNSNQLASRILFGDKAGLNEFPWMVYLRTGRGYGGATLINSRWVLTAAHNIGSYPIEVHLGEWNTTADPDCVDKFCAPKVKIIKVDKVIVHELWKPARIDIALLHLAESITFNDYIQPICLPLNAPEQQEFANKIAVAAGWGATGKGSGSDILLKAPLKVQDSENCGKIVKNKICASGIGKSTTASGDSGGPLMIKIQNNVEKLESYYQIGVLSYGITISPQKMFTYVPAFINWINDTILKN